MAALMYLGIVGRLDRWWISASAAVAVLAVAALLLTLLPGAVIGARTPPRVAESARAEPAPKAPEAAPPARSPAPAPAAPAVDTPSTEAVRAMLEAVAEMTALNAARTPRGAPGSVSQGPGAAELQVVRDRAVETMRTAGTPEPRVRAIRATFSDAILRDLEGVLWRAVQRKIGSAASPDRLREIRQELTRRIGATRPGDTVKAVRPFLEEVHGAARERRPHPAADERLRRGLGVALASAVVGQGWRSLGLAQAAAPIAS
jgi:hypothetical protein